jgi:hypothetical protein
MVILWSLFVMLIVVVNVSDILMKIRVNDMLPSGQQFSWWSRDFRQVTRKHKELFPDSYLPVISKSSFWFGVALLLIWLVRTYLMPD